MIRAISPILASVLAAAVLASACGEGEPGDAASEPAAQAPPAAAAPDPTMLPTPQQSGAGAMTVTCGGQPYGLSFGEFEATLTYDDGATAALAMQQPGADSEPGATVFSDGKVSIARSGGGDAPTLIRFARARMAWEDCTVSAN